MSYASGRAAFQLFCSLLGHDPRPSTDRAAVDLLLRFVEFLHNDRGLRSNTISTYTAAVRHWWHRELRCDPSAGSRLPSALLRTITASSDLPPLFRRNFMSDWLPFSFELSDDPVVALAFVVGFSFFLRVSEYLTVSRDGAAVTQLRWAHIWVHDDALWLDIVKSKTDLERRGSRHSRISCGGALCPVGLFLRYAASRPSPPDPASPAFAWADGRPFTADQFNALIKRAVARGGADPLLYSSHSMRSGGVTAMHAAGASIPVLIREGRWASIDGLMKYLRLDPYVGSVFTGPMLGPLAACAAAVAAGTSRVAGRFFRDEYPEFASHVRKL